MVMRPLFAYVGLLGGGGGGSGGGGSGGDRWKGGWLLP